MPLLKEGLEVLGAWGYNYITCAFNWVKTNPNVKIDYFTEGDKRITNQNISITKDIYSGLGSWVCGNSELCLLGKKGKGVKRINKSIKQILIAPRGKHSSKPSEARTRIEMLFPENVNKLEVFAREKVNGWDSLGNEVGYWWDISQQKWIKI